MTSTDCNVLTFDTSRLIKELSKEQYTDDQQCLIKKMKSVHHLNDETLNTIKLIIYDWSIDDAVKYYKHDKFCIDYFLNECTDEDKCQLQHQYNFYDIWNIYSPQGFKLIELLLEYILYTNKRPNCSNLYCCYGHILRQLIKTEKNVKSIFCML